jgi:hypothetical protein
MGGNGKVVAGGLPMSADNKKDETKDTEAKAEEETFPSRLFGTDSLLETTRKERSALLALSTLGIVTVWGGLIPKKISALGIELEQINEKALMIILAILVSYFWIAFFVLALADVLAWAHFSESPKGEGWNRITRKHPWVQKVLKPYGLVRGTVEFVLSLIAGLVAIVLVLGNAVF